jgi:phosphotransferase system HPr-like phosphotransfer protein
MSKRIKFKGIQDVRIFVTAANKVEGDVTLKGGKYTVDGKSIMGILSLDLINSIVVEFDEDETEFAEKISSLEV